MHRHFRLPALAALFLTGAFSVWAADTPVKGGTLIYLEQQPHTNLYPPAGGFYPNGGILNQITDKLTWQNPKTLEIEPWIAESWTSNADKTEYTFHLRKGVTFSDGTPLDAAAVAKNFDTYGLGDKAHRLPVSEVINNYQRSEVIDPLTVKFYFNKPSPGFLQGTATIGSGLVSLSTLQRNFEELGDARHIIGSGPFVVQDEKPGRELTLVARKDYQWGPKNITQQGPANLDGITYIVTPEDSVRIGALLAGQAGFIRQVQAYDEKQATDQGFKIYAAPTRGVNDSLSFRPDNPLVADLQVRQALLHATNARQVVKSMFFPNNRDALLQKGGSSDKVQRFRDDKLNDLLTGISAAVEPQQRLQLTGDAQRYLIDNAYVIPIFEEPQVFAGAPWVKGVSFEAVGRPSFYGAWLDKH